MADGRSVAFVPAQQCCIGAVKGGDDARLLFDGEHGAGEDGGGGVWDGVVDVQNIQAKVAGDLGHFDRERKGVVGVFEEAIVVDFNRMKKKARGVLGKAEGAFVGDEVDFVAAAGEFFAQGGGQHAAAADRGIAGNADFDLAWLWA